jgi:3-dehydroquinate dehydratase type I
MVNELIAVPIIADNPDDARRDMDLAVKQGADILEVRFDYQRAYDDLILETLLKHNPLSKIYTNRHKSQAGPDSRAGFRGSEVQRRELLQQAIEAGVEYFDLEFGYLVDFRNLSGKSKHISSYHNFEETPSLFFLGRLSEEMFWDHSEDVIPDIIKVATKANNAGDAQTMLDFLTWKKSYYTQPSPEIIALCMGEYGKRTRIESVLHGAYLTFACLDGKASAAGQMTISEVREAIRNYRVA